MPELPTGTVTFVFTDIEGSTRLLQQIGPAYADVLDEHRRVVRELVAAAGGVEFGTEGDAFFLVFTSPAAAVQAAAGIQRRTAEGDRLRIRIGVHTGEGDVRGGDYVGIDVHRAARIAAAGHGGQVLLSDATRALVQGRLPAGVRLRDLGEHSLKDLTAPERIWQLDVEGLPVDFPPLRAVDRRLGNLPVQLTSFVGRHKEIEAAAGLLRETHLLTLTGPGGTGKTRLALRLADTVAGDFPDGVWFVPLASVFDPALVPTAVAESLALSEAMGDTRAPIERLADHLRDREALLVLDNFEQILPAADAVATLLRAAPRVKVLVTSRSALRLSGEQEFGVPPLALPDPSDLPDLESLSQYEAVALFIERATAVKPDFRVTNENAPAVAEICARLDGLPLAIELAAARVRLLTPQAMLARLGDRLALLSGGPRDLPARQQTLRHAVAWSHDLLSDPERRLFARLASFVGGWAVEQAEAVCGPGDELGMDVLEGLESLADKSLVAIGVGVEESPRFSMLETIREFARERLEASGELASVRSRHAAAFLALAERAAPNLTGSDLRRWLDLLEPELDNFRAAIDWSVERGDAPTALRLAAALWRLWQMRGSLHDGRLWVERCLSVQGSEEHPRELARAYEAAGGIAYWQGETPSMIRYYDAALETSEVTGDPSLIANALYNRSFQHPREPPRLDLLHRSLALYERLGDEAGIAKLEWAIGNWYTMSEDYESGRRHVQKALALARKLGDRFLAGWALYVLGALERRAGNTTTAADHWMEGLDVFAEVRDVSGVLFHLEGLAAVARDRGRMARALRLAAASEALRATSGTGLSDYLQQPDEGAAEGLSEEEAEQARKEGGAMTMDEAVAYALSDED